MLMPPLQAGTPDPFVGPGKTSLPKGSLHPWAPQSGSRHPFEAGTEAWGMETDLEGVRSSSNALVCISRDLTLSPVVLPHESSSTWAGCHSTNVGEALSVCLSQDCFAPRSYGESFPEQGSSSVSSPVLARSAMVCGPGSPSRSLSMGDSH